MPVYKIFRAILLTFVLIALAMGQIMKARADTVRREADDQRALVKAQSLLKQMSAERDTLKAENTQLKERFDAANAKLAAQRKNSEAALSKYQENNTGLNERLQALTDKNQQLSAALLAAQNDASARTQDVRVCAEKNLRLYQISQELTDRYRSKGVFDALLQKEPVTQLKRVEIDNIAAQYRDLLEELKSPPPREAALH